MYFTCPQQLLSNLNLILGCQHRSNQYSGATNYITSLSIFNVELDWIISFYVIYL